MELKKLVATDNASRDCNLMLIMKLVAVVVMTLSAVMIATDNNDNYINILCLLILELHNILCVSFCVCWLLLTIQRRVLIIRSVFLSQVRLNIKKCHQNLLVKN